MDARPVLEWVEVPPGEFEMGRAGSEDASPVHRVRLRGFQIGKFEVTIAQYAGFLKATGRAEPNHWTNKRFNMPDQPVVGVNYEDAVEFCRWIGGRLPTEAEWEYAARGTDGRYYPWGNEEPDATRAVYHLDVGFGATKPVGSASAGKGPFGTLDQAGGVFEWCSDWYDPGYYSRSPRENPTGPATGEMRVIRGGSWLSLPDALPAWAREKFPPASRSILLGFRVARDIPA